MSSNNVIGDIDAKSAGLLSLQWKISTQSSIFVYSSYDSAYLKIRSPSFIFENKSWQISLDCFSNPTDPYSRNSHLRVCILDDKDKGITSCENKRGLLISNAEIIQNGNTYKFRKISSNGPDLLIHRSHLQYLKNYECKTISVELRYKEARLESEGYLSPISGRAMSPSQCKCAGKPFIGLSQNLKDLYLNQLQCDLTINVGQRIFKVHKSVMTARSPVFAAMMKHDMEESKSNVVVVTDCDPEAFDVFLLYLYSGETDKLLTENVIGVYFVADKYSIEELKATCTVYMKTNLCVDKFCDIVELASEYNESDLLKVSQQFFAKNAKKLFQSVRWSLLMKENTTLANELLFLLV